MATHVVNNTAERDRTGTGWIVGIIVLLALVLLFLFAGAFFTGNGASVPGAGTGNGAGIDANIGGSAAGSLDAGGTGGAY